MDPSIAFKGQRAAELVRPLLNLLKSEEGLKNFEVHCKSNPLFFFYSRMFIVAPCPHQLDVVLGGAADACDARKGSVF